jgi:hypothetical protein
MTFSSVTPRVGVDAPQASGLRQLLWPALLVAASVAFNLGFACAVPFAAFGAAAALTLSRRDGVLLMGALWLANQLTGFAVLGYPWTTTTFEWGAVLGVVAVLTTVGARAVVEQIDGCGTVLGTLVAFVAAFLVYEGVLFAVSATLLGGTEIYTMGIMTRILLINAAAFGGLLVLGHVAMLAGLSRRSALPYAAFGKPA